MRLTIEIRRFKNHYSDNLFGCAYVSVSDEDEVVSYMHVNSLENYNKCIPFGNYKLLMTYSPKFKRPLLLVDGVAGRSGIRIHPFNYGHESQGCITFGILHDYNMLSHTTLHCTHIENLFKICDSAVLIIK